MVENLVSSSIAIAGAWGYIGQKFLDAARSLKMRTLVYDPGPVPPDIHLGDSIQIHHEEAFYRLPADIFHLAMHPGQRRTGLDILMARSGNGSGREETGIMNESGCDDSAGETCDISSRPLILCEKPMALPEQPDRCREVVEAAERTGAILLYDFPELYDPMTRRVREYLSCFHEVTIESIFVQRSKDREDPAQARNYKKMVPIQYQESVHCLAFVLDILSTLHGNLESVFSNGISVRADSELYDPPNPEIYPHVVDGKCDYELVLGPTRVEGQTNFRRGAEWTKRRILRGVGDGLPFVIDIEFLEGRKRLSINGQPQQDVVDTNSYVEVIRLCRAWHASLRGCDLMAGLYPNPAFAQVTYQLSSLLWWCSRHRRPIALDSHDAVLNFHAGYAEALVEMPGYSNRTS
ncbi:MAG: hypothetical protein JW829_10295 [Pirellulales bacterium]|nr:hypothetical protein [Pirellulales bacterium]